MTEESLQLNFFFIKNYNLPYLSLGLFGIKDVQAAGEAFSPQKGTSRISKHEISSPFFYFCGSFLLSWIRIRIPTLNQDSESGSGFRI
jgi:hypothetical protein